MGRDDSRLVTTAQEDVHPRLEEVVRRQRETPWRAPEPGHAREAIAALEQHIEERRGRAVVLDVGCGTGHGTLALAERFPELLVLGLDRSSARLSRAPAQLPENAALVRCDAAHVLRAAASRRWNIALVCLLYPNPYPKASHLRRRWHAHPSASPLLSGTAGVWLRTNWEVYAREFQRALELLGRDAELRGLPPGAPALTRFERKYQRSSHDRFEVLCLERLDPSLRTRVLKASRR